MSRSRHCVLNLTPRYDPPVPKLWTDTLEGHRREVVDAILAAALDLVDQHGGRELTMSRLAEAAGIGRATLYKYFPDVDAILVALHQRHIQAHLDRLLALGRSAGDPLDRLHAVLDAYATLRQGHAGTAVEALLHGDPRIVEAHQRLQGGLCALLAEGAAAGRVRADVPPEELATFCLHALTGAGHLGSPAAAHRLSRLILAAVAPP